MSRRGDDRGFTLLEVIVALAISGFLMIAAHSMSTVLADHAETVSALAASGDREANGDRLLRQAALQVDLDNRAASGFGGNEQALSFSSWCNRPAGWLERCEVSVMIDTSKGISTLILNRSGDVPVVLRSDFRNAEFRYLRDVEAGGQWFRVWGRGISAPRAIGVIIDGDTAIVRMGERG